QLQDARLAATAREALARDAQLAMQQARQAFDAGTRAQAIEQLQAFAQAHPDVREVTAACESLREEDSRLTAEAKRRAEADERAAAAESQWNAGDASGALAAADAALTLMADHAVAQRIRGLARARVREEEQTAARHAEAAEHAERAS